MIDYEYKLFKCVSTINDNDDLLHIQDLIIKELEKIPDHLILEIFVLIMDEMILKKFPDIKQVPLLEEKYFRTSFGGNKYFIIIQSNLKNRDASILRLLYVGLKLGFNGQYEHVPENLTESLENLVNPKMFVKNKDISFIAKKPQSVPMSALWVIVPMGFYYLITSFLDMYLFSRIKVGGMA